MSLAAVKHRQSSRHIRILAQWRITCARQLTPLWLFTAICLRQLLQAFQVPQARALAHVRRMFLIHSDSHWHWPSFFNLSLTHLDNSNTHRNPPAATQSSTPSPSSKAWIAGPVIGAVVLIAFISFALWFIRHKRRERFTTDGTIETGWLCFLWRGTTAYGDGEHRICEGWVAESGSSESQAGERYLQAERASRIKKSVEMQKEMVM